MAIGPYIILLPTYQDNKHKENVHKPIIL